MLSFDFLDDVRRMNKRQLYYQVLNFGMIVSSALMIWKGLMVVTGSESPIVVVLRNWACQNVEVTHFLSSNHKTNWKRECKCMETLKMCYGLVHSL
uniref:Signal peptidase complex catalytic subunit SEC11 n=1 Tax=Cyprinus carpio carpio TaxID=630221 RepID=A0A9J7YY71_CYPCA